MIKALHNLHPPFWFILGGSLCEDLGFFHSFKTSPRSSKSESGCESYACFSFGVPAVFIGRTSGTWPDVRAPGTPRMSGILLDVRPSMSRNLTEMLFVYAGCPALGRMSGAPSLARCPGFGQMSGPCNLFFCVRVCTLHSGRMSGPRPGCPARHSHLHSNGHICTTTIYIPLPIR
jgi:hypothetical protein